MAFVLRSTTAQSGDASWTDESNLGVTLQWDREIPVTGQGGNTRTTDFRPPTDIAVSSILVYAQTAPTTAGTYTFAVSGNGNNLISAATFDLTSLVSDTLTTMTLTATAADLNIDTDQLVRFTFASNNGDLAGSGLLLILRYATR